MAKREDNEYTEDGQWKLHAKGYYHNLLLYREIGIEAKSYRLEKGKWKKRDVQLIRIVASFVGPMRDDPDQWSEHLRRSVDKDHRNDDEVEVAIRKGGLIIEYSTSHHGKMEIKGVSGYATAKIDGYGEITTEIVGGGQLAP